MRKHRQSRSNLLLNLENLVPRDLLAELECIGEVNRKVVVIMSVFVNWVLACEFEFAVVCDVAGIADVERIDGSEDFAVEHLHRFESRLNTEIL